MARIPEAEIERIKRAVSLERIVSTRVQLKQHGDQLLGLCPFHADKAPSLVVSPAKNLWNCLGACQSGGTVIDWVMREQGVSFRHAVELLKADVDLSAPEKIAKQSTVTKLPAPVDVDADDEAALRQVVSFYRRTFEAAPEAKAYLEGRGLLHPDLGDFFSLGFANRTLGYRLPQTNRRAGAELRGRLQRLGVLRASGHEHMNGSLVVPLFSEDGRIADLYGRKITSGLRKGTPLHLYLPGPHAGVFNWPGVTAGADLILCESILDAMTFWCAGFRNVTTSYGVSGFTEEIRQAMKTHRIRRVLIAYDRDAAGDAAAQKLAPVLAADGMAVYRVLFPKGMDANDYAQKMSPAGAALDLVIRQAIWMAGKTSAPPAPVDAPKPPAPKAPPEAVPEAVPKKTTPAPAPKPPAPLKAPPDDALVREASPGGAEPKTKTVEPEESEHELVYRFGARRLRVRGLSNNKSYDLLKVNLFITHPGRFFVDTVDLYQARQRAAFLKQAADELELPLDLLKEDLGKVILSLEQIQEKALADETAPKHEGVTLTQEEREEALGLLRDPHLMRRILGDFERLGVVGEETNKLVGYLATVSRKLDRPLAVIVQSSSAAGKSSLMEAVLAMVPEEERIKYSAMTGQSLYYLGETDLKHKILAIVEEEGAERASYALKLLQSEGELTIASTGKDPQTGQLKTNEYHVEGPVMIFLTTTAIEIDEELLNRCMVLTVDEGSKQTEAIHQSQRKGRTLAGLFGQRERASLLKLHNNAQRLLRRLPVVNPYAERLTFSANKTRTRRDHMKYLTLIDTVALLGQYQRQTKTAMHAGEPVEYIEVTPEDIAVANQLAHQVLGRTLDELPPQTRRLLGLLQDMVDAECKAQAIDRLNFRFSRRQVREVTGWGNTQLKLHLGRLVEMEYLVLHRTHHAQRYLYELSFDGRGGGPYLSGLIDPEQLLDPSYPQNRSGQKPNRSGPSGDRSGSGRPEVGGWSGGGRVDETILLEAQKEKDRRNGRSISKKRTSGAPKNGASYAKPGRTSAKA